MDIYLLELSDVIAYSAVNVLTDHSKRGAGDFEGSLLLKILVFLSVVISYIQF